ncbi:MAG: HAD family phosphatase [Chlamydiia bacterium]|nr:HAD family phosphatase [Chlamydiia bacterium]
MGYRTIIFDLGNVLVNFSHQKMFSQIASLTGHTIEHIEDLLVTHRMGYQYERGLLSSEEIYEIFQKDAPKTFEIDEFLDAATSIFHPKKEMETLVETLKRKGYQLILISNTSRPHYTHIAQNYPFLSQFDHIILSYEVGAIKPEKEIFEYALKKGKTTPSSSFFIDDLLENVLAAEHLGIRSHHFTSPSHLMEDLVKHGIL